MGPCECVEGARFFNYHQPHTENTRDHRGLHTSEKAAFLANCGQVLEPHGLKPRQNKGCQTMNRPQLPGEGCDLGPKRPEYVSAACSRMKGNHTLACPKKPMENSESTNESETAMRDKFAEWGLGESRIAVVKAFCGQTWHGQDRGGENRCSCYGFG